MGFLDFFNFNKKSKDIAKDRLKLVLIHDKGGYSPKVIDVMKNDILETLEKYIEFDEAKVEIKMIKMKNNADEDPTSTLVANIPVKKLK